MHLHNAFVGHIETTVMPSSVNLIPNTKEKNTNRSGLISLRWFFYHLTDIGNGPKKAKCQCLFVGEKIDTYKQPMNNLKCSVYFGINIFEPLVTLLDIFEPRERIDVAKLNLFLNQLITFFVVIVLKQQTFVYWRAKLDVEIIYLQFRFLCSFIFVIRSIGILIVFGWAKKTYEGC